MVDGGGGRRGRLVRDGPDRLGGDLRQQGLGRQLVDHVWRQRRELGLGHRFVGDRRVQERIVRLLERPDDLVGRGGGRRLAGFDRRRGDRLLGRFRRDRIVVAAVEARESPLHGGTGGDADARAAAGGELDGLDGVEVERVGAGDLDRPLVRRQHDDAAALRDVGLQEPGRRRVGRELVDVHQRQAQALGEPLRKGGLFDHGVEQGEQCVVADRCVRGRIHGRGEEPLALDEAQKGPLTS